MLDILPFSADTAERLPCGGECDKLVATMSKTVTLPLLAAFMSTSAFASLPHAFSYGGKAVADLATRHQVVLDDARHTRIIHEWTSPDGRRSCA